MFSSEQQRIKGVKISYVAWVQNLEGLIENLCNGETKNYDIINIYTEW